MEEELNEKPIDQIEERLKRIEAIYKAKQNQKWQKCYTSIRITNFEGEFITKVDNVEDDKNTVTKEVVEEVTLESEKTRKRKAACLVAKALGIETTVNGVYNTRNFFDCNACLEKANDPVLTCCGHLFCWECFYQLPYAYSNAKECPVCEGEVVDTDIIPVYGNGTVDDSGRSELKETGLLVPDRPQASRVESTSQRSGRRSVNFTSLDWSLFGHYGGYEVLDPVHVPSIFTD